MSILGAIPNLLDPIFTSFSKSFLKSWLPIHLNWPTSSRWLLVELTSAWIRGFDELCLPSPYTILFSRRTQLLVQGAGQDRRVHAQCRRTFKSSELPTTRARYQWRAIIGDRWSSRQPAQHRYVISDESSSIPVGTGSELFFFRRGRQILL